MSGLSPIQGSKTVDSVLALVDKDKWILRVYLIELKSQINDRILLTTVEKLEDSINRFYFLLLLNDHKDFPHKDLPKDLKVSFKGVVFYNGEEELKEDCPDKDDQIHKIFKDKAGSLACNTILEDGENIPIQFYAQGFKDGEIRVEFTKIAAMKLTCPP